MKHVNAILNDRQETNLQLLFTTAWIDAKANESESLDLTTEDIDVTTHDMIDKELYVREQRRSIV